MEKRIFLTNAEALELYFLAKREYDTNGLGRHRVKSMMLANLITKLERRIDAIPE